MPLLILLVPLAKTHPLVTIARRARELFSFLGSENAIFSVYFCFKTGSDEFITTKILFCAWRNVVFSHLGSTCQLGGHALKLFQKKKKRCCHPLVQSSLFAQAVLHDLHCQNIRNVISKATEGNTVYLSLYKQSQTRKWEAVGTPIKDFAGLSLCLLFVCVTKYKTLCYIR